MTNYIEIVLIATWKIMKLIKFLMLRSIQLTIVTVVPMERIIEVLTNCPLPPNSQGRRVRGFPTRGRSRGRGRKSGNSSEDSYNNTTKLQDEVSKLLNDGMVSAREQRDYLRTLRARCARTKFKINEISKF